MEACVSMSASVYRDGSGWREVQGIPVVQPLCPPPHVFTTVHYFPLSSPQLSVVALWGIIASFVRVTEAKGRRKMHSAFSTKEQT